jgi:hypothetical protein
MRSMWSLFEAIYAASTDLLTPLATACHDHLPQPNPIGLPVPSRRG